MSFLAPLFLAGLAALAIPLLVHLRRRHQRQEVEFPSLMFLRDIPYRSRRRRTLRNRLLLALRMLALALLVAAFSRPFLADDATASADVLGPRELVLLVDRSWSMSYGDRWSAAVEAVQEETASLGPEDRVTLVLFDEGATAPIRSSPDAPRVTRAVEETGPGDRATRFAPALRLARNVLETSNLPRREVVLVSDLQASGWSGEDAVSLPAGVTFTPRPVGPEDESWTNVTVQSVELRRSQSGERDAVLPTARILRRGTDTGTAVVEAVLEVDGQVRERIETEVTGGSAEIEFGPIALENRPLRATVRTGPDDLPADDVHRFVVSPGRTVSVLVLEPSSPRSNTSLFLRRALELSRDPPVQVEVGTGAAVPADLGERFDVVVLNDRDAPPASLRPFLEEGGGLLWAPGAGGVSAESGSGFLPASAGPMRDHRREGEVRLGTVDRDHPVFDPFRESGTGNFSAARFFRTRGLTPDDSARVVARFDDGGPALVEGRVGRGRVLVWGSTLHTFWTDLPLQPVYLPFLHRAVLHLANRTEEIPSYRVGAVLSASGEGAGGDGVAGAWAAIETPGSDRLEEGREAPVVLDEAGFYELLDADDAVIAPVAVNVDPGEGDLGRRDVEEVVAAVAPRETAGEDGETAEAGALEGIRAEDLERHQGLWRFLLVAAFFLLVGETALSNRLSRGRARS